MFSFPLIFSGFIDCTFIETARHISDTPPPHMDSQVCTTGTEPSLQGNRSCCLSPTLPWTLLYPGLPPPLAPSAHCLPEVWESALTLSFHLPPNTHTIPFLTICFVPFTRGVQDAHSSSSYHLSSLCIQTPPTQNLKPPLTPQTPTPCSHLILYADAILLRDQQSLNYAFSQRWPFPYAKESTS